MSSTYTTNGGIEKIGTGEQSGTWGTTTNLNFDIIDRLINGIGTVSLSSSGAAHTLTTTDGTLSDGMYKALIFTSASENCTVTVSPNSAQKIYYVINTSGYTLTFTQGSGANVTVANNENAIIYCNGSGTGAVVSEFSDKFLSSANNLSDVASASTARSNLGLAIGTNVLAYDANLQAFATAFTLPTSDGTSTQVLSTNGSGTLSFSDAAASGVDKGFVIGMSIVFGA
jgi:hypothetical protein